MDFDYSKLQSLPEDEFNEKRLSLDSVRQNPDFRLATPTELREVESYLEVQDGTLKNLEFYLQKATCDKCGKSIDFEDFVRTSVSDGGHSKSGVLHTLLGNKRVLNKPRQIKCSSCETITVAGNFYASVFYGCQTGSDTQFA